MRKLLYLAAVLLLAACRHDGPALSCQQIAFLQDQVGTAVTPADFQQWVSMTYQLPLERITIAPTGAVVRRQGMTSGVMWESVGLKYGAQFGEGQLLRVWLSNTDTAGEQLLACLGQPTHYVATSRWEESGPWHSLDLFFPGEGTMAQGWQAFPATIDITAIPVTDGQFLFKDLMIVKPQSVEQIINLGWGADASGPEILKQLKPWPGSWAEVEFPPLPERGRR